jgi:ketosteroid isomerase-like protein
MDNDTTRVPGSDDARIRRAIMERETAMRGRDAKQLISGYTADCVKYDLAPPLANHGPAEPDALARWFAGFDGAIEYDVTDLAVTAEGDLAYCTSLNRLSCTPRGMSERFELWFRATLVLRSVDGTWLIAHEHNSTPFYMDGSFRAAVDLKPEERQ